MCKSSAEKFCGIGKFLFRWDQTVHFAVAQPSTVRPRKAAGLEADRQGGIEMRPYTSSAS